ncbi:MAG: NifU family protein [Anaerolineales bacterium]
MKQVTHNHEIGVSRQEKVQDLIDSLSAYIEQYHGGWVRMIELEDDVLRVELGGACDGCSLSPSTLQGWIGGTVRQFFPEIKKVISV